VSPLLACMAAMGAAWPFVLAAWLYAVLGIARLVLGRWPAQSGADDPKGIPIVGPMYMSGLWASVLSPIIIAVGVGALMMASNERPRLARRLAGAVVVAWFLAAILFTRFPFWAWIGD